MKYFEQKVIIFDICYNEVHVILSTQVSLFRYYIYQTLYKNYICSLKGKVKHWWL